MRETVAEPEFKTIAIFGALDKLEEELVALGSGLEPKGAWDLRTSSLMCLWKRLLMTAPPEPKCFADCSAPRPRPKKALTKATRLAHKIRFSGWYSIDLIVVLIQST